MFFIGKMYLFVCFPEGEIEAKIKKRKQKSTHNIKCTRFPTHWVEFEKVWHFIFVNFEFLELLLLCQRVLNDSSSVIQLTE